MNKSIYIPQYDETTVRGKVQKILNVEKTLKAPLKILEDFINGKKDNEEFEFFDLTEKVFKNMDKRDTIEIDDMLKDKNFKFTDDKTIKDKYKGDKIYLNVGDLKDILIELERRRYLDIKYDLDYVLDTLLVNELNKGTQVFFGRSAMAIDSITYYRIMYKINVERDLGIHERNLRLSYKDNISNYNIQYTRTIHVTEKGCVDKIYKDLFNEEEDLGLNIRDRKRNLKYHLEQISLSNFDITDEVKEVMGLSRKDKAIMEGSDIMTNPNMRLVMNLYEKFIKHGYIVNTYKDSSGFTYSSLLNEMLWEYMILLDIKDNRPLVGGLIRENDPVIYSLLPAFNSLIKVIYTKSKPASFDKKSVYVGAPDEEYKLILDHSAASIGIIKEISEDGNNIKLLPTTYIGKDTREYIGIQNIGIEDIYPKTIKIANPKDRKTSETFISDNSLKRIKFFVHGSQFDDLMHHISTGFNLILDKGTFFEEDVNAIPWLVGDRWEWIEEKGYYHRETIMKFR